MPQIDDHDHEDDHDHAPPPPPVDPPEAEANGFGVPSTTNGNQSGAGFQSLSNGNFVISFLSNSTADDDQDIRARFFRLDGSAIGPDVRVNETTTGTQTGVSSLALNDGSVLITWRSPDPDNASNSHLFGRRFSANGEALTGEVHSALVVRMGPTASASAAETLDCSFSPMRMTARFRDEASTPRRLPRR